MSDERCSHGVPLIGHPMPVCLRCDLVWEEEVAANARDRLTAATTRIGTLKARIAKAQGE